MKITILKKADKKPNGNSGCMWLVDALPEPRN